MKEKNGVALLTAVLAALSAYLGEVAVPVMVLAGVMALDYATGVAVAWGKRELNSRTGLQGIVKKVSYLAIVAVGMAIDYVAGAAGQQLGVRLPVEYLFGLMVCIWLIVNECISILENAGRLGLPVPEFIGRMLCHLKERTESMTERESGDDGEERY